MSLLLADVALCWKYDNDGLRPALANDSDSRIVAEYKARLVPDS
jgi:hypothetical protein